MKTRTSLCVVLAGVSMLAVVSVSLRASVVSQTQPVAPGSMAEVVAEIRLLRASFEERSRHQAIAAAMAAQQARVQPLVVQLGEARKDLDKAAADTRAASQAVQELQYNVSGSVKSLPDITRRFQTTATLAAAKETDLRRREGDLVQAIEREDAVWSDLLARLQEAIRR